MQLRQQVLEEERLRKEREDEEAKALVLMTPEILTISLCHQSF